FGMGMFDRGRNRRAGTESAIEVEGMAAFIDAPSIVFTTSNKMRRFPEVLPVISHPNRSGFSVDAHPPGIAQTVSPVLRPCIGHPHERVVFGHGVRLRSARVIDINAQDA